MKRLALCVAVLVVGVGQTKAGILPGELIRTFDNPTPATYDGFGWAVAGVGNNVLAGAPRNLTGQSSTGHAYLFNASTGFSQTTFGNPTPNVIDNFGFSVAGTGNNILVGAPADGTNNNPGGAAYLFDSSGGLLQTYLNPTPDIAVSPGAFGWSVAMAGNNVFVGDLADRAEGPDAGAVYRFDTAGNLLNTIPNPSGNDYEYFGYSLAMLGDNILAGAPTKHEAIGSAYLMDVDGNVLQTFQSPTGAQGEHFGYSVESFGDNVLVSAPGNQKGWSVTPGAVYLFDSEDGSLLRTFLNPTPEPGDHFGTSVAMVGGNVLIGAALDNTTGANGGAAYLFDGSTGDLMHTFLSPAESSSFLFGGSVAAVGNDILVGAYGENGATVAAGRAYLFKGFSEPEPEVIPEPSSLIVWCLIVLTFGGFGWWRKRGQV